MPVVAAAIFGLIGVLVGGVLNFVTTMYVQGRSDRSSLRSMARLAYDDCLHFQSTLVRALADGDWWPKGESIEPQLGDHDRKLLHGEPRRRTSLPRSAGRRTSMSTVSTSPKPSLRRVRPMPSSK